MVLSGPRVELSGHVRRRPCQEISQGYVFFAYPWDCITELTSHPEKGVEDSSHPFRARIFLVQTTGGCARCARLTPANFLTRLRRTQNRRNGYAQVGSSAHSSCDPIFRGGRRDRSASHNGDG